MNTLMLMVLVGVLFAVMTRAWFGKSFGPCAGIAAAFFTLCVITGYASIFAIFAAFEGWDTAALVTFSTTAYTTWLGYAMFFIAVVLAAGRNSNGNGMAVLALLLLPTFFATTAFITEASSIVECKSNPCQVLEQEAIAELKAMADFDGLYLQYGDSYYKAHKLWLRAANPLGWGTYGPTDLAPSTVILDRDSYTSVPEMGIFWWKNQLIYNQPGFMTAGEVGTPLSNPDGQETLLVEDIVPAEIHRWDWSEYPILYRSYSWDGTKIMAWLFVPQVTDTEVIINIVDFEIIFLVPTSVPSELEVDYTPVSDIPNLTPGETMTVSAVYTDVWEVTDEYFVTTYWRGTVSFLSGYQFDRVDREPVRVDDDDVMTERACTPEEHCYSRGFSPQVGQTLYVSSYTMRDLGTDWGRIWLQDVHPAVQILDKDFELLQQRIEDGQVVRTEGRVTRISDVNDVHKMVEVDGMDGKMKVPLLVHYVPPVGTRIVVYSYIAGLTEEEVPYASYISWGGNVMALFSEDGLWFFNTAAEYGNVFSSVTYNRNR